MMCPKCRQDKPAFAPHCPHCTQRVGAGEELGFNILAVLVAIGIFLFTIGIMF
jgi:hypothetical protein